MKGKQVLGMAMAAVLAAGTLAGCGGSSESSKDKGSKDDKVTLEYWTWFPSEDQAAEVIKNFEKENPDIKINMTVMESKAFQEKVPLALSTEEDIDIIGVQPSAFAEEVQDYLADLDPLMEKAAGSDWKSKYSEAALAQGNALTGDATKMLVLVNSGSMIGYVNMDLMKEIGGEIPKTIEEYKALADKLHKKYPDKYAGVFAGKEAWVCDEMMLTVMGQQGDYYNKWRYDKASTDSKEFKSGFDGLKRFFDEGIFSKDIMDLDFASAAETFSNGEALIYFMGSWESPLLSPKLREGNGIDLKNVGAMALPTVEADGKPAVRGYLDSCIGVVNYSEKQEAAAKFVAYMTTGDGADTLSNQLLGPSGKIDCKTDETLFGTKDEKNGWKTVNDLISNATADRNNVSGYSDIEGAAVQSVLNGTKTSDEVLKELQKEWTSGKY